MTAAIATRAELSREPELGGSAVSGPRPDGERLGGSRPDGQGLGGSRPGGAVRRSAVRVLRVPRSEPLTDDERDQVDPAASGARTALAAPVLPFALAGTPVRRVPSRRRRQAGRVATIPGSTTVADRHCPDGASGVTAVLGPTAGGTAVPDLAAREPVTSVTPANAPRGGGAARDSGARGNDGVQGDGVEPCGGTARGDDSARGARRVAAHGVIAAHWAIGATVVRTPRVSPGRRRPGHRRPASCRRSWRWSAASEASPSCARCVCRSSSTSSVRR